MKSKTLCLWFLLILISLPWIYGQSDINVMTTSELEAPLRFSEPVETIISDLESYIPAYLQKQDIPGLTISLVHDHKIAWTKGFGIANTITNKPVTKETLFEVASISKIVTAYIALRLVDQGMLSLDESLNAYLSESWLPLSEYRDAITLRHVLSHSSGLGHNNMNKDILFTPGSNYSYSNKGFSYLQSVIEQVTGKSLEEIGQKMVFEPLGMLSSSYINHAAITSRTANGHIRGILIAQILGILLFLSFIVIGLPGLLILRILRGHWRPTKRMVIGAFTLSFMLSILFSFILFGKMGFLKYAWLITIFGCSLIITFAVLFKVGLVLILHFSFKRSKKQIILTVGWSIILLVGCAMLVGKIKNCPVPKWPEVRAMAHASFRTTAEDLATFLIELYDPQYLSKEMASQMGTPQIHLSNDLSWGLGPGIQHCRQGNALWQWGQNIDFQSVMIIYPDHGFGVVVMTNSDSGNPDVAIEIAHQALGGTIDPIHRGSHLEFNYQKTTDH